MGNIKKKPNTTKPHKQTFRGYHAPFKNDLIISHLQVNLIPKDRSKDYQCSIPQTCWTLLGRPGSFLTLPWVLSHSSWTLWISWKASWSPAQTWASWEGLWVLSYTQWPQASGYFWIELSTYFIPWSPKNVIHFCIFNFHSRPHKVPSKQLFSFSMNEWTTVKLNNDSCAKIQESVFFREGKILLISMPVVYSTGLALGDCWI